MTHLLLVLTFHAVLFLDFRLQEELVKIFILKSQILNI